MLIIIQLDATVCRYLFSAVKKYLHTVASSWIFINNKSRVTRTLQNQVSDMPKSSFRELINCAYGMVMALQVTRPF